MNKRTRLAALLGAGLLTFAVAGLALAHDLGEDHSAQIAPTTLQQNIDDNGVGLDCSDFVDLGIAPGAGEVGLHFVQVQNTGSSATISGSVDSTAFGPVGNTVHGGDLSNWQFYVVVDGGPDSVIDSATTSDVDGGKLQLSHICFGSTATATPSFSVSGEPTTDVTVPVTDALSPSGTSGPSDSAWLLVVALGVLLASVVVLTPARAKGKR